MPFIVQDSDDEEDLMSSPLQKEAPPNDVSAPVFRRNSAGHVDIVPTEKTSLKSMKAQGSTSENDVTLAQYELSPTRSPKRRKVANEFTPPRRSSPRRRTLTTHDSSGRKSNVGRSQLPVEWDNGYKAPSSGIAAALEAGNTRADTTLAVPGNQDREHEASSTVPADTLSQQRLVEEAIVSKNQVLFMEQNIATDAHSSSSHLWSVPNSSDHRREHRASESESGSKHSPEVLVPIAEPQSPENRAKRRKIAAGALDEHVVMAPFAENPFFARAASQDPAAVTAANQASNAANDEHEHIDVNVFNNTNIAPDTFQDDISKQGTSMQAEIQETQPSKGRKAKKTVQPEIGSDEIAIGLPKEQYKPRPSRSRSAQVDTEPVDLTIAPEKAARAKRRKTVATIVKHNSDLQIGVESAADLMPFSRTPNTLMKQAPALSLDDHVSDSEKPQGHIKKLASERGQVALEKDKLIDATMPHSPTRQQPDENVDQNNAERNANNAAEVGTQDSTDAKPAGNALSHIEISFGHDEPSSEIKSSPKRKGRKAKRRKTTQFDEIKAPSELQESDVNDGEEVQNSSPVHIRRKHLHAEEIRQDIGDTQRNNKENDSQILVERHVEETPTRLPSPLPKKGRGRPKKTKETGTSEDPGGQALREPPDGIITIDGCPLVEIDPNDHQKAAESGPIDDDDRDENSAQGVALLSNPASPVKPLSTPPQNSRQHSPISKGKVPYRVGLSKRVRIPSLLKVRR
ncbi:MAG: hypothetical protein M1820_000910 [Bogoriella megaspora]|nr:MAG: hypothetical protein M1820_000910 [Bogoriella megaspora]